MKADFWHYFKCFTWFSSFNPQTTYKAGTVYRRRKCDLSEVTRSTYSQVEFCPGCVVSQAVQSHPLMVRAQRVRIGSQVVWKVGDKSWDPSGLAVKGHNPQIVRIQMEVNGFAVCIRNWNRPNSNCLIKTHMLPVGLWLDSFYLQT